MSRADSGLVRVSVVYLRPGLVFDRTLQLGSPATVGDAIEASGIRDEVAELSRGALSVGVFGRRCELTAPLRDGDRVEVYRPLLIDPKEARRMRAALRRRRKGVAAATR